MPQDVVGTGDTPNTGRGKWNNDIGELFGDIADHITDAVDSHDASSVSFAPAGGLTSTNAQSAIVEAASMGGGGDVGWEPVRVATTEDIDLTTGGLLTVDGVTLSSGNRVLVHRQITTAQNGIYVVASGAWTRATDANAAADFGYGKLVYVSQGDDYGTSIRAQNTNATITPGTTAVEFFQGGGFASEDTWGLGRVATQSETNAGMASDPDAFVTPEKLAAYTGITNKLLTSDYQARDPKDSVRVATTANITLSGAQTIDGISVVATNRVLVKNQSTGSQNGIYLCASGAWTRATDADTSAKVTPQMYMRVEEGTANANKEFYLSNTGSITLGTTALTFAEAGGSVAAASETVSGIAEIATQTETDTGTDDARIVTPLKLASRTATDTRAGVVELATDAETQTGTDTARAITPANLSARSATETRSGVAEIATQTETDTGTDDARIVTALKAATRFLAKAGGTLTGFLTLHADPTSALHAVTKQYADALVVGGASPASETVSGIAEIATQTETDTGTDDARIVTPLKLATRTATDTRSGVVELATDAETQTGTDTARAITPANLSSRSATETRSGVAEVATQAETDTGTDDTRIVTPLKLATYSGLGGGSSYRTLVNLGSDVVNATTSYADVTGLSFTATSGVMYRFEVMILYDVNAASTGSRWSLSGPASPTFFGYTATMPTSTSVVQTSSFNTYDAGTANATSPFTAGNVAYIRGFIQTSSTGTVVVRFASEVAVASGLTAKANSTLEYW